MRLTNESDYVANDFNDLCTIIEQLEHRTSLYSVGMATQSTLWYRGQANSEWEIIPGIQRSERASSEHLLCHSFYHGVSQITFPPIPKHSYDQWIPLMQHYGLPTRLLDWSYSPLIALYFAVDNYEKYTDTNASITVKNSSGNDVVTNNDIGTDTSTSLSNKYYHVVKLNSSLNLTGLNNKWIVTKLN